MPLTELSAEEVHQYVTAAGGTKEQAEIVIELIETCQHHKYTDIINAVAFYIFLEGFGQGVKHERGESHAS